MKYRVFVVNYSYIEVEAEGPVSAREKANETVEDWQLDVEEEIERNTQGWEVNDQVQPEKVT